MSNAIRIPIRDAAKWIGRGVKTVGQAAEVVAGVADALGATRDVPGLEQLRAAVLDLQQESIGIAAALSSLQSDELADDARVDQLAVDMAEAIQDASARDVAVKAQLASQRARMDALDKSIEDITRRLEVFSRQMETLELRSLADQKRLSVLEGGATPASTAVV